MGPGAHLKAMLASARIRPIEGCNCESFAVEMDNRGLAWCRLNRDKCSEQLVNEARERGWPMAGLLGGAASLLVSQAIEAAERDERRLNPSQAEFEQLVRETIEQIRGPSEPRPAKWELRPEVVEAHKRLLQESSLRHSPAPQFGRDRGIITLAGGVKYFTAAYVLIHQLRALGCRLPVQLWYLGREELDHAMERLVGELGDVECVDLQSVVGNEPRRMGGWEAKIWAIQRSPFREVLFLDADNNPVVDPTGLFDCDEFRRCGAVLWPDLPNAFGFDITSSAFTIAELPVPGKSKVPTHSKPSDYRPVESGQILVDKSRVWNALETCRHLNDHSDFWFGEPRGERFWYIYGDKSTFYLGFETTKTPYAMPDDCEWFGSQQGGGFRQFDFAGRAVFEHRCQPTTKIRIRSAPNIDGLTNGEPFLAAYHDLVAKWTGKPWAWEDQSPEDHAVAQQHCVPWMPYGLPATDRIELLPGGRIKRANGLRWRILHHGSAPYLVISNQQKAIAFLGQDDRGNWANHVAQQFLVPAPPADFDMRFDRAEITLWTEITHQNEYRLPVRFEPGCTVVDVGAHVGIFARECLERGAEHVICCEPNLENFGRLLRNLKKYGDRVTLINAACWRSDEADGWLRLEYKPGAQHSGGGSVVDTSAGQLCRAVSLDALLALVPGQVRLLKLDCEGAEWPILFTVTRLDQVEEICGEYHLARLDRAGPGWRLPGLQDQAAMGSPGYWLSRLQGRLRETGFASVELIKHVEGLGWMFARRGSNAIIESK